MSLPLETITVIKENVSAAEKAIKELEPEIARAKAAGLDVSDNEKTLNDFKNKLANLRAQYGRL